MQKVRVLMVGYDGSVFQNSHMNEAQSHLSMLLESLLVRASKQVLSEGRSSGMCFCLKMLMMRKQKIMQNRTEQTCRRVGY